MTETTPSRPNYWWGIGFLLVVLSARLVAPYIALNVALATVKRTVGLVDIEGEWTSRIGTNDLERSERRLAALEPYVAYSNTYWLGRGMIQFVQGRTALAMETWTEIQDRRIVYALGKKFEGEEDFDLALRLYERALALDQGDLGDSNLYYSIGFIRQQLLRPPQPALALQAYQAALAADDFPVDVWQIGATYHYMGQIYAEQRDWPEALAAYERAQRLSPGNYFLQINYASALAQNGQANEAVPLLEDAIDTFPQRVLAYRQLAGIYVARQAWGEAIAVYEAGLAVAPNDPILRDGLAAAQRAAEP